jgi:hypothetical protein
MRKLLALIAIVSFATLAQAGIIVTVSGPTSVSDPVTSTALDSYTVSVTATGFQDGGVLPAEVTAVDVSFDGPLHQIMPYKSAPAWPKYTQTPQDQLALDAWAADYIASDSHFLLSAANVVFGAGVATEDLTAPPSAFRDDDLLYHGPGTYLRSGAMGLKASVKAATVQLAQIVIPAGSLPGTVVLIGTAATNGAGVTTPFTISPPVQIPVPEPATLVLLGIGSLLGLRRRK